MSFKLFLVPAIVVSVLYGFVMASIASADTVTVGYSWEADCALVDEMVECDISSEGGISNVHVFLNSGIGPITVLDQDYKGCPTEVHVVLDPIVIDEDSEMVVTTCISLEVCFEDNKDAGTYVIGEPCEKPDDAVGLPDSLPLKLRTEPVRGELLTPGVYVQETPIK